MHRALSRPTRLAVTAASLAATLPLALAAAVAPATADSYTPTYSLDGTMKDAAIVESSGLAHSTRFPGILWTHNDKGDTNRVFAVDATGKTAATVTLDGATHVDWEDIAAGPDHSLWVADVGDNDRVRPTIDVYRFTEPTSLTVATVDVTRFTLAYPDGVSRDAEGLMIDPDGRLYVVQKGKTAPGIFAAPTTLTPGAINTMTRVGTAPVMVTAAAWAPDGGSFSLADYSDVYTYSGLGAAPVIFAKPTLKQGESLEYTADSARLVLGSEGKASPLYSTTNPLPAAATNEQPEQSSLTLAPGKGVGVASATRFVDGTAGITVTAPPSEQAGSGVYLGVMARSTGIGSGYRAVVRFSAGTATLNLVRMVDGSGATLKSISLGSYTSGTAYRVEIAVAGSTTVEVKARAYPVSGVVPVWQANASDTASSRIAVAGDVTGYGFLSANATGGPMTVGYRDLT